MEVRTLVGHAGGLEAGKGRSALAIAQQVQPQADLIDALADELSDAAGRTACLLTRVEIALDASWKRLVTSKATASPIATLSRASMGCTST